MGHRNEVIRAFQAALGEDRVLSGGASFERFAQTTLPTAPRPLAVIRPQSRDEVVAAVSVAGEHEVPLYPISRGKNWGYGDACAVLAGQVIVDLSRMDAITAFDDALGTIVIEPGVTQGQLFDFLVAQGGRWWMDASGSGMGASVLGNSVERGFGHTPYGDHYANTASFEVVLADGSVVNTGLGDLAGPKLAASFKWGLGPAVDGIFTQSNLGIVTRATLWLMPKPERCDGFVIQIKDETQFPELIERLRPLRQAGVIQSNLHIANDLRALSSKGPYPWEAMDEAVPLSPEMRARLRSEAGLGAWAAIGGIYGTKAQVKANRKAMKAALKGLTRPLFFTERMLATGERFIRWRRRGGRDAGGLGAMVDVARPTFNLQKGEPSDEFLKSSRWRSRSARSANSLDPLDANSGFYWVSPLSAMTGAEGKGLLDLIQPILVEHGFEPMITVTLLNGRAMVFVTTIYYDRSSADESTRARACHDELMTAILDAGHPPYRAGIEGMRFLDQAADGRGGAYWDLVGRLKDSLDPKGIFAPGRYDPRSARQGAPKPATED
jgi:4-cresol dehydrogenase (hydroxylating) flavoprotein subunit